jgi:hypothetical protein
MHYSFISFSRFKYTVNEIFIKVLQILRIGDSEVAALSVAWQRGKHCNYRALQAFWAQI